MIKHLIELYQTSLKRKNKCANINIIDQKNIYDGNDIDIMHLKVADFLDHPESAK